MSRLQALSAALAADVPALLWGAPGVGKTAQVHAAAAAAGAHLEILIGSTLDPTDLGYVVPSADGTALQQVSQRRRRRRCEAYERVQQWLRGEAALPPDDRLHGGALERAVVAAAARDSSASAAALARAVPRRARTLRRYARQGLRRVWRQREAERQAVRRECLAWIHAIHRDATGVRVRDRTASERAETAAAWRRRRRRQAAATISGA